MTVASSTSERVIDGSAVDDSPRDRESGIVGVAGGNPIAGSSNVGNPIGAGLIAEGRVERSFLGAEPLDTEPVNTMTAAAMTAEAMTAIAMSSNEVSVSRESVDRNSVYRGIVDQQPVDREASSVASAVQSGTNRDDDIDIAVGPTGEAAASNGDEGIIEVADDEIETADPALSGSMRPSAHTLPSPASSIAPPTSGPYASFGVTRSRPPAPPSSRPRMPMPSLSGLSLPRPLPPTGAAASNRPSGMDPWALANKTLELAHANARIGELEELVAYRDARILELEENLARTRRKLEDLEQRSRPVTLSASPAAPIAAEGGRASSANEPAPQNPVVMEGRVAALVPAGDVLGPSNSGRSDSGVDVLGVDVLGVDVLGLSVEVDDGHDDPDNDGEDYGAERDSGFGLGEGTAIARDGSEDDLQQISGIGPRFEAALRKHGITRLSQIAAWSESDVRQVAKALKIPKSRIVKGRWVEVAREVIGTRAASE
jgi:hypothetical protein